MGYSSLFSRICFSLLLLGGLLLSSSLTASAATFNTTPVNAGCSYPCHGYYTGHFDAKIEATNYSSAYWETSQFRATMTHDNQNGDEWGIMTLTVHSLGGPIFSVNPGKMFTAKKSSYWQRINRNLLLLKGDNRVEFHMAYVLKDINGQEAERWYPIRRISNIQ